MSYTRVNHTDIEPVSGAMHTLSDPLDIKEVGVTILQCKPGWWNCPHNYLNSDHKEIYILMEVHVMIVYDESIGMGSGDAIRVPLASTHRSETAKPKMRWFY